MNSFANVRLDNNKRISYDIFYQPKAIPGIIWSVNKYRPRFRQVSKNPEERVSAVGQPI